ncbi:MAG: hypothetical protein E7291_05535 [Lachnospiraceae bacterium]|nr:hypothetical protein [Lachnospiraceae bacterium]
MNNPDSGEVRNFFIPNTYIENQSQWNRICFGRKYQISYCGCEVIAVYNALLSLGEQMSGERMVELISFFEKKGATLGGKLGISPKAAYDYFRLCGYKVTMLHQINEETINAIGVSSDTVIVTAYNNKRNILKGLHTVNISKDDDHRYYIHNGYRVKTDSDNNKIYTASSPYRNLAEAVANISGKRSASICIIAINRL